MTSYLDILVRANKILEKKLLALQEENERLRQENQELAHQWARSVQITVRMKLDLIMSGCLSLPSTSKQE